MTTHYQLWLSPCTTLPTHSWRHTWCNWCNTFAQRHVARRTPHMASFINEHPSHPSSVTWPTSHPPSVTWPNQLPTHHLAYSIYLFYRTLRSPVSTDLTLFDFFDAFYAYFALAPLSCRICGAMPWSPTPRYCLAHCNVKIKCDL